MSYSTTTNEPTEDEEAASMAGIALAPWVAERARIVRELHLAERMAETDQATRSKVWKRGQREAGGIF